MLRSIVDWFGWSASKKDDVKNGISIMDAHNAHIKCKARFQDYLRCTVTEKLDPAVVGRDDQCELGKWIHGPALNHFKGHGAFYTLRADHAQLHFIAGNVVKKAKDNERAAADALLDNEYAQASRKVMRAVTELNKQIMTE